MKRLIFTLAAIFAANSINAQTQKCIDNYNAGVQAKREGRYTTAYSLYKKAADDCGMNYAYIALGKMYYSGVGVEKNWCEALKYFNKSSSLDSDASAMKNMITSDGNNPCDGSRNPNAPLFGTWETKTNTNTSNNTTQNNKECRKSEFTGTKKIDNEKTLEFSLTFCSKGFTNNNAAIEEKDATLVIKQKKIENGVTKILIHKSIHSVKSTIDDPNMASARLIKLTLSKIEKSEFSISNIFDINKLEIVYLMYWDDQKVRLLNREGWGYLDLKDANQEEDDGWGW